MQAEKIGIHLGEVKKIARSFHHAKGHHVGVPNDFLTGNPGHMFDL
jgi:hypothetical protein